MHIHMHAAVRRTHGWIRSAAHAHAHARARTRRWFSNSQDVEFSFCPGEGWLAARYIFNDLDDMVSVLGGTGLEAIKKEIAACKALQKLQAKYDASSIAQRRKLMAGLRKFADKYEGTYAAAEARKQLGR